MLNKVYDEVVYSEGLSDFASLIQEIGAQKVVLDFAAAFPDLADELLRYLALVKKSKAKPHTEKRTVEIKLADCKVDRDRRVTDANPSGITSYMVRLPSSRRLRRVYVHHSKGISVKEAAKSSFYYVQTNEGTRVRVSLPKEFLAENSRII